MNWVYLKILGKPNVTYKENRNWAISSTRRPANNCHKFRPPTFLNVPFGRKNGFVGKITRSSANVKDFSINFFFAESLIFGKKNRHFSELTPCYTRSKASSAFLADFEKKIIFYWKKPTSESCNFVKSSNWQVKVKRRARFSFHNINSVETWRNLAQRLWIAKLDWEKVGSHSKFSVSNSFRCKRNYI